MYGVYGWRQFRPSDKVVVGVVGVVVVVVIVVVVIGVVYRHWGRIEEDVIAVITRAVLFGMYYLYRELNILHR